MKITHTLNRNFIMKKPRIYSFPIAGYSSLILILALTLGGTNTIQAQEEESPRLYIGGSDIAPRSVDIKYEISFPGYVQLHLYSENKEGEKKKIWIKGKVHDETGKHIFRIPRKPLEPGRRYSYELMYKGNSYEGSFYHPEESS